MFLPIIVFNPFASGNGAGFGAGQAGPGGVSAVGVGMASSQNGGFAFGTGQVIIYSL